MTTPLALARAIVNDEDWHIATAGIREMAHEPIRVKSALLRSGEDSAKIIGALGDELAKCREELREAQAKLEILEP